MSDAPTPSMLPPLPLTGRAQAIGQLRMAFDAVAGGAGRVLIVSGTSGIGKTRLMQCAEDEAARREWVAASGRAFAAERGVPYALLGDALLPAVRHFSPEALTGLTRGVDELAEVFPMLRSEPRRAPSQDVGDFRVRLFWHFTEFIRNWARQGPLLIKLDDLQWADASSLELVHFLVRQTADVPVLLLCSVNTDHGLRNDAFRSVEQSLSRLEHVSRIELGPLLPEHVSEIVERTFQVSGLACGAFVARLHHWTGGNPFFIDETLKMLVSSGALAMVDGRWTGWDSVALRLPASIREAVLVRLGRLSESARNAADAAAVVGHRFSAELLASMLGVATSEALTALDELRRAQVVLELEEGERVLFDFAHPLLRETVYTELGAGVARAMHGKVVDALELNYGAAALDHADELAYHCMRATDGMGARGVAYLMEAGRAAMHKYANLEAADYLAAALARLDADVPAEREAALDAAELLARAHQRCGDYEQAMDLWRRTRDWAEEQHRPARAAAASRMLGLGCFWGGRLEAALDHYDAGLEMAGRADDTALQVRLLIGRAICLQEMGQPAGALETAGRALALTDPADAGLMARVHRTLLLLHLWTGEAALAREHGARALEFAELSGGSVIAFLAHWAMTLLEGFSGNSVGVQRHLAAAEAVADELRSPVLRLWTDELALEYAYAHGDWERALTIGESAISRARVLQQGTMLPRLLVWTGLIHLGRGNMDRGTMHIEEAWKLAEAEQDRPGTRDIHSVIVAHVGRARLHMAAGDYEAAVRTGEAGLALADSTGYLVWSVHRLLPIIAESHLWLRNLEGARRVGARLRTDSDRLGHRLGTAWSEACDALVLWLSGDGASAAVQLQQAAERLESVPFMLDAARLRRQLAGRLADMGDREGAVTELRVVHDRLELLGAEQELTKARAQFRELGVRPPVRRTARDGAVLTDREAAIARLVAAGRSSKSIARELDISVRTVDTHLGNIYRKLDLSSRAELSQYFRTSTGEL